MSEVKITAREESLQQRIAELYDLKQQLADGLCKLYENEDCCCINCLYHGAIEEWNKTKRQLAERDMEIETWRKEAGSAAWKASREKEALSKEETAKLRNALQVLSNQLTKKEDEVAELRQKIRDTTTEF